MRVYLVYNVDPKYMFQCLLKVFRSQTAAEDYQRNQNDLTDIQEWGVEE